MYVCILASAGHWPAQIHKLVDASRYARSDIEKFLIRDKISNLYHTNGRIAPSCQLAHRIVCSLLSCIYPKSHSRKLICHVRVWEWSPFIHNETRKRAGHRTSPYWKTCYTRFFACSSMGKYVRLFLFTRVSGGWRSLRFYRGRLVWLLQTFICIYIYIYIYDDRSDGRGRSLGVVRYSVWFYLVVYIEDSV